jgi:phosphoglycerol transferase MdoB-like AlkP superfamily enzyme
MLPLARAIGVCALFFAVLLVLLVAAFAVANLDELRTLEGPAIAGALQKGLRFQLAVLCAVMAPAGALLLVATAAARRPLRRFATAFLAFAAFLLTLIALADIQYFEESGKHLTYEATAYWEPSGMPILLGAFALHPWLSTATLAACIAVAALAAGVLGRAIRRALPDDGVRLRWAPVAVLPLWLAATVIGARGGVQSVPLGPGESVISSNPYLNALCLPATYSVLRAAFTAERGGYRFYDEAFNVRTTRVLLGLPAAPASTDFPLLRTTPGSPEGNRINVVLVVLESWSGKDVGALGGRAGVTPVFDELAARGAFFDDFYATGMRTAEGIFSILCSFPNQPVRPIMDRPVVHQVRWRCLSEILGDAGYRSVFIHGRDLGFDHMDDFLGLIRFHHVIDRSNFGAAPPPANAAWAGYDDEQVMIRADEEFAAMRDQPFLGVIYTLNTHPPFTTPESFPLLFPPRTIADRFLNSLHYSDHALGRFFARASTQPYFARTIFVIVADHARTRDRFDFRSQHSIPFLIYAPGRVEPARISAVAGQSDILPTVLGLLELGAPHSSFGRDLFGSAGEPVALSVTGDQVRWQEGRFLYQDRLGHGDPLLFDVAEDPTCTRDVWQSKKQEGMVLQAHLRAYLSLSQTLLREDRIYPRDAPAAASRSMTPRMPPIEVSAPGSMPRSAKSMP